MEKPSGKDLLALLISLYADQEGVEINYEIIERTEQPDAKRCCNY